MSFVTKPLSILLTGLVLSSGLGWAKTTTVICPKTIEAKVQAYVLSHTSLPSAEAKLVVETLHLPSEPITLNGEKVDFILSDSRSNPLTSRTIIQVTVMTEADTRTIGVPVHIYQVKPVWVTNRLIRSREAITLRDLNKMTKQVDLDANQAFDPQHVLPEMTSRMNIAPGTILDDHHVLRVPLVSSNEEVRVKIAMSNGVQLTVYGKALQDGGLGEQIRVARTYDDQRTKIYQAKVIGKNLVLVEM